MHWTTLPPLTNANTPPHRASLAAVQRVAVGAYVCARMRARAYIPLFPAPARLHTAAAAVVRASVWWC